MTAPAYPLLIDGGTVEIRQGGRAFAAGCSNHYPGT